MTEKNITYHSPARLTLEFILPSELNDYYMVRLRITHPCLREIESYKTFNADEARMTYQYWKKMYTDDE